MANAKHDSVVKQGYAKVKCQGVFTYAEAKNDTNEVSVHVGKWKKRWILLHQATQKAEKKLEIFQSEKDSKKSSKCTTISLENVQDIEMLEISSMAYYIILTFRPKAIEKVSFPSEMECKEWFEQLNLVCFGSVLGKTLHEALQVEPDAVKPDLLPSNATTNNSGFPAYLQPSAKLNISGECILQVTPESIYILDARSPTIKLVTWPLASLRRYGYDSNRFTFEAGRRCDTGEGIFVFKTKDGGTIHKIVQKYAEDLATLMRNNSITDSILGAVNEDDTSVQLRPLPPIPAEQ